MDAPSLLRIDPTHTAAEVAEALIQLFEDVERMPCKVSWVQRETERGLDGIADAALATASRAIAQAIDAEGSLHDRQPYHSRQHFCEVMLAASVLCQLHALPPHRTQLLLLAALIHDWDHDGRPHPKFRLERQSIARALPHLVAAGIDRDRCLQLTALVLATEPHDGLQAALRARDLHTTGRASTDHRAGPPELSLLEQDAELSRLALLLCEADVLPSVGLTTAYAMRLQDRLARELGRELGPDDKRAFLADVLSAGVIGPFFLSNLSAIEKDLKRPADGSR